MSSPSVLVLSGSLRRDSLNEKLAVSAAELATEAGARVTRLGPEALALPLLNQDEESSRGKPASALELKRAMIDHQALLIASPEYNSSVTGALKNAIDWASRPDEGDPKGPMPAFRGKVVGLLSASPGGLGGLRGLVHLRGILGTLGCLIVPEQAAVGGAYEAFDAEGRLTREADVKRVGSVVKAVLHTTSKLHS